MIVCQMEFCPDRNVYKEQNFHLLQILAHTYLTFRRIDQARLGSAQARGEAAELQHLAIGLFGDAEWRRLEARRETTCRHALAR